MSSPRSIEQLLYDRLMKSPAFHRFVRSVYYRVNGLDPAKFETPTDSRVFQNDKLFKPTALQKFKAWRLLFYDEWRSSVGLRKKWNF